jgi:hypothetical protein
VKQLKTQYGQQKQECVEMARLEQKEQYNKATYDIQHDRIRLRDPFLIRFFTGIEREE